MEYCSAYYKRFISAPSFFYANTSLPCSNISPLHQPATHLRSQQLVNSKNQSVPDGQNQVLPYICLLQRSHLTIGKNRPLQFLFHTYINTGVSGTFFSFFALHYPCFWISNMNALLLYKVISFMMSASSTKEEKYNKIKTVLYLRGMSHLYGPG